MMKKLTVLSILVVALLLADTAAASPRQYFQRRQFGSGGLLNFFGDDIFGGTPMGSGYRRFLGWGRPRYDRYGGGEGNNYQGTDIGTMNEYNLNL
ncbi:unnamed protein product [Anisakis simplex]|uniref:Uncharacterized protein n=1 Tax=Anisakis simplex TaxID=6269 RepID=A0A0M3K9X7_ANISI|nr:unnamed protein product [Anisakis simplex]